MIEIVEYKDEYRPYLEEFLFLLETHTSTLDPIKRHRLTENFKTEYTDYLLNEITEIEGKIFFALFDSKPVGFTYGYVEERSEISKTYQTGNKTGYSEEIFVLEEYRGKGIASLLYETMEKYFIVKGVDFIKAKPSINNIASTNLLMKMGYVKRYVELGKEIKSE